MTDHALPHPRRALGRHTVLISRRLLIAAGPIEDFAPEQVAAALARGLLAGGLPEPDVLAVDAEHDDAEDLHELLQVSGFDRRMRDARAVLVAVARLDETTLAASPAFEIATRARQAGVPAYAITAANGLDAFDARILDLQLVVEARGSRGLAAAARRLADVV
ncbi:MAG TPA: glycerate kinase [Solirubrobacteraceae bacterium]|jgi:glycerate kinase